MEVVRIDKKRAKTWIENKHYKKSLGIFWEGFGLLENNHITGVVCYGQPAPSIQKHAFKDRNFRLYELTRLVIQTKTPNAASFLIANSLKMLKEKHSAVISYADSEFGHVGIVYQATNWIYTGNAVSHSNIFLINGEKIHSISLKDKFGITKPVTWAKENNIEMIKPQKKHRYFYLKGTKKQKKIMLNNLRYDVINNYPKSDKTVYDDGKDIKDIYYKPKTSLNSFFKT